MQLQVKQIKLTTRLNTNKTIKNETGTANRLPHRQAQYQIGSTNLRTPLVLPKFKTNKRETVNQYLSIKEMSLTTN